MSDILAKQLGTAVAPHVRQTVNMAFALALLRRHPMAYTVCPQRRDLRSVLMKA